MMRACSAVLAAVISMSVPALAGDEGWTQDHKAALERAKAESKDVLVDFTGSDWCIWCQRLDQEVFATDTFKAEAPKHFVLLKLDFPRDASLVTDEVRAQNEELQKKFGVQGFPTLFLLDADGRPYAKTSYRPDGPDPYLENLAELRETKANRDAGLAAAAQADGVEKARRLDAVLTALAESDDLELIATLPETEQEAAYEKVAGLLPDAALLNAYAAEVDQILELDAADEAGLKTKYGAKRDELADAMAQSELEAIANKFAPQRDFEGWRKAVEEYAATKQDRPNVLQVADFFVAITYAQEAKFDEALRVVDQALARAPQSKFAVNLERVKQQLEQAKARMGGGDDSEDGEDQDAEDEGADDGADEPTEN